MGLPHDKNSESPKRISDLPDFCWRQLFLFNEVMQSGHQGEVASRFEDLPVSTLSKDLKDLRRQINLSYLGDREFWSSAEAQTLQKALQPLKRALDKFERCGEAKIVSIGAGGSLLAWCIGRHAAEIRNVCSGLPDNTLQFPDVRLNCTPMSNREVLQDVGNGILDIGLIRKSLLDHSRIFNSPNSSISYHDLGSISYGIAVPDRLKNFWESENTNFSKDEEGYLLEEKSILNSGHFVSVGPEGEFRGRLYGALRDADIDMKVEFSYRSFPQIIPHLLEGTHFGLCPIFGDWKPLIPGVTIYPLRLLCHYRRDIVMVWNNRLKRQWIDVDKLADKLAEKLRW